MKYFLRTICLEYLSQGEGLVQVRGVEVPEGTVPSQLPNVPHLLPHQKRAFPLKWRVSLVSPRQLHQHHRCNRRPLKTTTPPPKNTKTSTPRQLHHHQCSASPKEPLGCVCLVTPGTVDEILPRFPLPCFLLP